METSADYEYFEATAEDIDNALRGLPEVQNEDNVDGEYN